MQVNEQEILSFSQEVWAAQLGLNIQAEPAATDDRTLSSCIKVSGPWHGTILLECSESVVRHAAAMLFSADGESASEEEISDALKELAEMLGKKMRSVLPESSKLSRPSILLAEEQTEVLADQKSQTDVRLSCEGRPVRIALLDAEPDLAAAG